MSEEQYSAEVTAEEYEQHIGFAAEVWKKLSTINVNEHVQQKNRLNYLSWSWAWSTLMTHYPQSTFKFLPDTVYDGTVIVNCEITVRKGNQSLVREMWLACMDFRNKDIVNPKAMDINKAKMRCLVKCIGMLGLGLYIYAGEDLPEAGKEELSVKKIDELFTLIDLKGSDINAIQGHYKVNNLKELTEQQYNHLTFQLNKKENAQ